MAFFKKQHTKPEVPARNLALLLAEQSGVDADKTVIALLAHHAGALEFRVQHLEAEQERLKKKLRPRHPALRLLASIASLILICAIAYFALQIGYQKAAMDMMNLMEVERTNGIMVGFPLPFPA
jgi:hypothetical protein